MIYLGTDHAGFELKEKIKQWLSEWDYEYEDMGAHEYDQQDDYPDFISLVGEKVSADPENSKGIILGASGQGEAVAANKYKGVRAVVYYGGSREMIIHTREHDDANVLSLGASFVKEEAQSVIKLWLEASFSGEERHVRRINKIKDLEK